uniref:Orf71 n=1 Tax=Picobiliphyte sp. MS584-11 TaxID=1157699 RepID=A0A2H4R8B2_9EUKA|nr:orf71 [Picobiliphyte sp. MS584-11]
MKLVICLSVGTRIHVNIRQSSINLILMTLYQKYIFYLVHYTTHGCGLSISCWLCFAVAITNFMLVRSCGFL